jgi:tetratricopeptide (TPR) repeat protein
MSEDAVGAGVGLSADRYSGFVFDPGDLAEDVDLDLDRRREILFVDGSLATFTLWQVLGLPWNAPAEAARAAYLEKVKIFHPDRYAGKRLGSYRARLERVFRRLTEARDTLGDEARRVEYARRSAPPDQFARIEARRLEDERRAEERRARLSRTNPLVARAARVAELVKRGREAFDQGRFAQAATDLQLALSLDPRNAELGSLVADARRKAGAVRAADHYDLGVSAEVMGRPDRALAAYRQALEADPGNVRAGAAAARVALQLGDRGEARARAEAVVRANPQAALAHEALGIVLEAEGQKKEARKELERAVELDPRLESARERLKKLRWSFL